MYSKERYSPVSFVYWTPVTDNPIKSLMSVGPSFLYLASSTFFLGVIY